MGLDAVTLSSADSHISEVTASAWLRIGSRIMEIERESFPESIRDSPVYYARLASSPTAIFIALTILHPTSVVGYLAADILENFAKIPGVAIDPHFHHNDTIYIASVAIESAWRHRGLGIVLQRECLRRAPVVGRSRTTAHIHHGGLGRMGLGGAVIDSFENWYGTGKTFDYVVLPTAARS